MTEDAIIAGEELTVLVPVRILEGEQVPAALMDVLSSVSVVLLGYHVIPEQTAPEQARTQFGEQARSELDDVAEAFRNAGGDVEARVVFTGDATQTFERIAVEEKADAILLLNPAPSVERIFVALSEGINTERIAELTSALATGTDVTVTLFHVATSEDERAAGEQLLDKTARILSEKGVATDDIEREVAVSDAPVQLLSDVASEDSDLVVLGESRPTVRELVFGEPSERMAERTLAPILVVRRLPALTAEEDDAETANDES
ncbi:universal stress family protein [Halogeometricum borinquense DSM 11551]|uniref:Universal stress family protein n=1 Tax=Halogeometricum borinquense (strain ATCC 700274 / DSM 11551 / JCM 10706 / KCTC 4070 / PR3) TaxID=469382 RepID=E4NU88_HALBP|nr:universal stress protein [Halogeometricum borinquense]ADQ68608.1 universal stress family protein [Halogeometricum borinquense DSM 11551]ELY25520.1 universal stress family protein [Halogeometricum borinquense DSM 11551]